MAETMTPAERLRVLAEWVTQMSIVLPSAAERADLLAGADALDRLAQTCGNCQHADTDNAIGGWVFCALSTVSPDERYTFPFAYRPMPFDERCKGWTKRENA